MIIHKKTIYLFYIVLIGVFLNNALAENNSTYTKPKLLFMQYEPSSVSWTKDNDRKGKGFLDFNLSVMHPLLPDSIKPFKKEASIPIVIKSVLNGSGWLLNGLLNWVGLRPYFAFNTRLVQDFERNSSPVIGKRFNPFLFLRFEPDNNWVTQKMSTHIIDYIDFIYAHESNGQSINSEPLFKMESDIYGEEEAKDLMSRGWDYLGLNLKSEPFNLIGNRSGYLTTAFLGKYFLQDGFLQGEAEEYKSWENDPEGRARKYLNGLLVNIQFDYIKKKDDAFWFRHQTILVSLETGYYNPFENKTIRTECSSQSGALPILVWYTYGYRRNVAQYFRKGHSFGFGFKFMTI